MRFTAVLGLFRLVRGLLNGGRLDSEGGTPKTKDHPSIILSLTQSKRPVLDAQPITSFNRGSRSPNRN